MNEAVIPQNDKGSPKKSGPPLASRGIVKAKPLPEPPPVAQPADPSSGEPLSWLEKEEPGGTRKTKRPPSSRNRAGTRWVLLPPVGLLAGVLVVALWWVAAKYGAPPVERSSQDAAGSRDNLGGKSDSEMAAPRKPAGSTGSDAMLVLDWPEADREGSRVWIDGKPASLRSGGKVEYRLLPREEPYVITLNRPGYEPIEIRRISTANVAVPPYKVQWTKSQGLSASESESGRRRQLEGRDDHPPRGAWDDWDDDGRPPRPFGRRNGPPPRERDGDWSPRSGANERSMGPPPPSDRDDASDENGSLSPRGARGPNARPPEP
jgi:hypothetical protein